jgi:hypothetical protein
VHLRVFESEHKDSFPASDPAKREIGMLELAMPQGGSRDTVIFCTVTLSDMSGIEVSAEDDRGNRVEAKFLLHTLS